jgi:DNA-binding GntR family transcriptional regulator
MARQPVGAAESVKQRVYQTLRQRIISGSILPDQAITIHGVAEELGVSAMPVREALHRLVADGALQYMDNRRVKVPGMTGSQFEEIIETRIVLETLAADRALPHLNEEHFERIVRIDKELDAAFDSDNIERATELNFAFHRAIYEVGSEGILLHLIESVWLRLGPFMREATANLEESYAVDRHVEAISAIREKDREKLKLAITSDIEDGIGHLGRHFLSKSPKPQQD